MATRKPSRKPRAGRRPIKRADGGVLGTPSPAGLGADVIAFGTGDVPTFDPAAGAIEIPTDDGHVIIQLGEPVAPERDKRFDANLAVELAEDNPFELGRISSYLLEAVETDERDRSEWLQQRSDGLDLLGQKVEKPGTGNVGTASTSVAGQSTVRDSLLSEACDQFQANSFAELCPSEGPCKVINYGVEDQANDMLAEELEKDFNFYLTTTAKEYYPDTRKMLWWTGYASGMFKKVYKCPLRNRPVSESVDGAYLLVPSNATDLHNAGRVTHQINMRPSVLRRMQLLGVYRDIDLSQPVQMVNTLAQKTGDVVGMNANPQRPEDQEYTIYECYCELDIDGYEHKVKGKPTGLALPYRVTIDKDSRQILEIKRNWDPPKDDEDDTLPKAKIPFVMFPYATGLGFYGTGLLHRLGNYSMALTAMLRECIDAGMFASFPGFLFAKPAGRQLQNEFRVPPGGGAPIDVASVGNDINKAVMPLPYKDVSGAMVGLMAQTRENAFRYAGMANTGVAEGKQDAPVGTTLAMIEQATKIEGGVHKALHAAQAEELQLMKELFRDDPEALWRGNKRPALGSDPTTRLQKFQAALENCELVPASDPNVPSGMHRLAKVQALLQLTMGDPQINQIEVKKEAAKMLKVDDFDRFVMPAQAPQPGPADMMALAKLQIDKQNADTKAMQVQLQHQHAQDQLAQQGQVEAAKIAMGHSANASKNAPTAPEQPDPFRAMELHLKGRQQNLNEAKLAVDAHNAQLDRDSKESIEAMKIVQTAGVHPESVPLMDEQKNNMSSFLVPAAEQTAQAQGSADGGVITPDAQANESAALAKQIKLAIDIAEALRQRQGYGTRYSSQV